MKYRRVLYAKKLTAELKSKLCIASYDKRRASKKNVYFVTFASYADMKLADRISKRLPNVVLKSYRSCLFKAQYKPRLNKQSEQKLISSSSSPLPSIPPSPSLSSISFSSPPVTLTFLRNCHSTSITPQRSPVRRSNETLEERAMRILGSSIVTRQCDSIMPSLEPPNFENHHPDVSLIESDSARNLKGKEQLIDNVQSCLNAMKTARQASDELCQLHGRGADHHVALNRLIKVYPTAFYLKVITTAQIKTAYITGLRLPWPNVTNIINELRMDIRREQLFMAKLASTKHILSKIDATASIAISAKLVYELRKLSH